MTTDPNITIIILGWDKFNPRKDYKHPRWFALSNRLLEDSDFFDFTDSELKTWIYILSQASQRSTDSVQINFMHAERVCKIKKSVVMATIKKLEQNQHVQITNGICTESVPDNTIQNNTNNTVQYLATAVVMRPNELFEIWNQESGSLPKIQEPSPKRIQLAKARLREKPDLDYWRVVIRRISASDFCNNAAPGSKGWRADVDFLLRPETHIRTMEGKYDNREGPANPSGDIYALIRPKGERDVSP